MHSVRQFVFMLFAAFLSCSAGQLFSTHHGRGIEWQPVGEEDPPPYPSWPQYFMANWTNYHTLSSVFPPFTPTPPPPYTAGRGYTFYDWTRRSMIEVYQDYCVPIFPGKIGRSGPYWACAFLNVVDPESGINTSYMITPAADSDDKYKQCCIYGQPWHPPPPAFLQGANATYRSQSTLMGLPMDSECGSWEYGHWPAGPFIYGFYDLTNQGWRLPAMFAARATEGWMTQHFYNFRVEQPPVWVWDIPQSCKNATRCVLVSGN